MVPSFGSLFMALSAWYPADLGLLNDVNRVSALVLVPFFHAVYLETSSKAGLYLRKTLGVLKSFCQVTPSVS